MRTIELTKGKVAIVCDCHYIDISTHKWCYSPAGYAVRRFGGRKAKLTYMHRVIGKGTVGKEVDHINQNKLDNRCSNLRCVSKRENTINRNISSRNTSGFKGVSWNKSKGKWQVQLASNGKRVYSAYFNDLIEAAKSYNAVALEYHGSIAVLNKVGAN